MKQYHVYEKVELSFEMKNNYTNPYMDVDFGVKLEGPNFSKKVYGFWDGGQCMKVRIVAMEPGTWKWETFSNQDDIGLIGLSGSFKAIPWTEKEKVENECRRGFINSTPNGRGFMHADGTPFLYIGDTWWGVPTFRFAWHDDDKEREIGPDMGFKDLIRIRKAQGYNGVAMIASWPNWKEDQYPADFIMDDPLKTPLRQAWPREGNLSGIAKEDLKAKDMHNEGGMAFEYPGIIEGYEDAVPDLTRINPEYFKHMDKKIDYMNSQGFVPFIEIIRRDITRLWKNYFEWPDTYARYMLYIFARYQANNVMLSPIHFDGYGYCLEPWEFNEPANIVVKDYGVPAFGQPIGTNASSSTLHNYGANAHWLTFHQIGNNRRTHDSFYYLSEMFRRERKPAINGEPYYPGFPDDNPKSDSPEAERNSRAALYGSFLSGGFGGYIYGVEGLWSGDIEDKAGYRIWDAIKFKSGEEVGHIRKFIKGLEHRIADLIPDSDAILPNKQGPTFGFTGWAYSAYTETKDLVLGYIEQGYDYDDNSKPKVPLIRTLLPFKKYLISWFDPREGCWLDDAEIVSSDRVGELTLPKRPDSSLDWGFKMLQVD